MTHASVTARRSSRSPLLALVACLAAGLAAGSALAQDRPTTDPSRPAPSADAPQGPVFVRDLGPGAPGRILRAALERPHRLLRADTAPVELPRGERLDRTVIVFGGDARVASSVAGDVIVVGGDLFLHPGAAIEGRAVAIGGATYGSTLASVRGGQLSFRDATFDAVPTDSGTIALDYRSLLEQRRTKVTLPGRVGLRIPTYDRIDGLSLAFGPEIALDTGRIRIEPLVTYRSHLGEFDPSLHVIATPGHRTALSLRVERATYSNELWIRKDLINSAIVFGSGIDARNHYRADRAELTGAFTFEGATTTATPYVGVAYERASSVARDAAATSAPWSIFGRDDRELGMLRPNPSVTGGRIVSALVGGSVQTEASSIAARAAARVEIPLSSPEPEHWTQVTLDGEIAFPAFLDHRFEAYAHGVATVGDVPPSQRFAYLGGSGTIPTFPLLGQGGDQLAWMESRYSIPLSFVRLPFGGVPEFTLRHIIGGAGLGTIPTFEQNVGVRLMFAMVRVDYTFDPARAGQGQFGFGIGVR